MFLIVTAYVMLYGKNRSGIKRDYFATVVFLTILAVVT
jgi:hypothetical protein